MAREPVRLWQATLTLLAGGALAQALPLLLGPLLSRLYAPDQWGLYTAFATVAANIAVVACARYEFALPMAGDDAEAHALLALALRVLAAVVLGTALVAAALWALDALAHAAWLPAAVLAAGAAQLLTMWATRAQRFRALAASRVVQHGGAAALQAVAASLGTVGLVLGPVLSAIAAALWLKPARPAEGWAALAAMPRARLADVARKFRDFPLLNTPHAFLNALSDTLAVMLIALAAGDAAVGFWGLALRYLKAPATLVGGAVSQALYPKLAASDANEARAAVRQVMRTLAFIAVPLALLLLVAGPALFAWVFGERWREAGELARALAPYIAVHFIASPLAVVTMAWQAQGWALRLAFVGQLMFLGALAVGLQLGGLIGAAWAVSAAMVVYFGWYFWSLATWKDVPDAAAA
jgi:O-antigen/teichoic acid export membrane protein